MADVKKATISVFLLIVGVIILLSIFGQTVDDVQAAGDDIQTCPAAFPTYNSSADNCYNATFSTANAATPPLGALFDGNGVVVLAFMAGMLLLIVGVLLGSSALMDG